MPASAPFPRIEMTHERGRVLAALILQSGTFGGELVGAFVGAIVRPGVKDPDETELTQTLFWMLVDAYADEAARPSWLDESAITTLASLRGMRAPGVPHADPYGVS